MLIIMFASMLLICHCGTAWDIKLMSLQLLSKFVESALGIIYQATDGIRSDGISYRWYKIIVSLDS